MKYENIGETQNYKEINKFLLHKRKRRKGQEKFFVSPLYLLVPTAKNTLAHTDLGNEVCKTTTLICRTCALAQSSKLILNSDFCTREFQTGSFSVQ